TRARVFGMNVIAYDPYIAQSRFEALRVHETDSLETLLEQSSILTLHTPLTDETTGMIGKREIARLPRQSIVVNMARGGIVDERALLEALASKHLLGAVVDAYEKEPLAVDHPLRTLPNVLLTPHIGASTAEAQRNVAVDVCVAVRDALLNDDISRSLNVAGAGESWQALQSAMLVARRSASVARAWLADRSAPVISSITLRVGPELADGRGPLLAAAALGALEGILERGRLNVINARTVATQRGIELRHAEGGAPPHPRA